MTTKKDEVLSETFFSYNPRFYYWPGEGEKDHLPIYN